MNQIPIYIINLKKDMKKKSYMKALCDEHSLQYSFVDAVYGKELSESYIDEIYSKKNALSEFGRELTKGEIGCALSHLSIYREIVEKNIDMAIIVEDDIVFEEGFFDLISSVEHFPQDWECILLGHYRFSFRTLETASSYWKQIRINSQYKIVRLMEQAYGTHGYLINKKGAMKFIESMVKLSKPVDLYTGDDRNSNLYAVSPPCVTLHPLYSLESNLHHDREQTNINSIDMIQPDFGLKLFLKKMRLFDVVKNLYDLVSSLPIRFHYILMKVYWPKDYKDTKDGK